jgi:phosphoserine phosphatase
MGRSDIAECGKRFSSEYQPAGRGRPKGSLNYRTRMEEYFKQFADEDARTPESELRRVMDEIFGKRKARRLRRRLRKKGVKMWQGVEGAK